MKRFALAALMVGLAIPAFAQTTSADPARAECKQKVEQMCPGVQPGGGRIKECLKQHNTTVKQLCPGVQRGQGHGGVGLGGRHAAGAPGVSTIPVAPTAQAPQ